MRLKCLHARTARARRASRELAGHIACKNTKLDLVLEPRVRESRPAQDIVLSTSISASHVSACSPRARAQTLNRNGIANCHWKTHIKLDLALERRVRGAYADQDIVLITSIYAPQVAPC